MQYCTTIYLEVLRQITKKVRVVGLLPGSRRGDLVHADTPRLMHVFLVDGQIEFWAGGSENAFDQP